MVDGPHFRNRRDAVRKRDHRLLNADIAKGHKSRVWSLPARTSYRVNRPIRFAPETETVLDDDEANTLLNQPGYRSPSTVPSDV